jgi:hypothetical protein
MAVPSAGRRVRPDPFALVLEAFRAAIEAVRVNAGAARARRPGAV